jgi:glucokinase
VWDETCRYLALAAINTIHVLDPEMLVLAGGMSKAGSLLLDGVRKHVREQWWTLTELACEIRLAELGTDAGMIGAAGLARAAWERGELPQAGS